MIQSRISRLVLLLVAAVVLVWSIKAKYGSSQASPTARYIPLSRVADEDSCPAG